VIVAARLGLLLLVALAAVWALVLGQGQAAGHYVCPMHPEVAARAPGQCPVCGMALEQREVAPPGMLNQAGEADARPIQAAGFLSYGPAPVHRRPLTANAESPAWLDAQGGVTALLFEDELRDLGRKAHGSFFAARFPGAALAVERAEDPPIHWRGSMWRVSFRFRAGAPPRGLRVGATGWLEWPSPGRQSLVVLSSAVLQARAGPHLLVSSPDQRSYRSQPIATGRLVSGYTVVVSGARERDLVFGLNAFSLDAQAQLQAQRRAAAERIEP
jgi:hypothetical protein